ncbi:MAG TPA: HD domain-containing phosphohydrolase [Rectinemataceae bacterium]|nr:HD domain-containing phosphohydrolase [Rectinemataceae bacterium]
METETVFEGLKASRIMLVDDEPANLKVLGKMLEMQGYSNVVSVQDPRTVVELYRRERTDLVLLDLNMPHMSGFDVMARLRELEERTPAPIIVLTAQTGKEFLVRAFEGGARDYVTKPFDVHELLARVRTMLEAHLAHRLAYAQKEILEGMVRERTAELMRTRLQVVQRLGRASEYRDNETGKHIIRVSQTAALIAKRIGWGEADCEMLLHATPMHDVGKIGIPDRILLKPGKLEPDEWEIMKTHTTIGAHILEGDDSDLLLLAREIALTHHEKWEGSGYPNALSGEAIPVSGRLVALADVFDALTSERPYKKTWSVDAATDLIRENRGKHFDPRLVDVFLELLPEITEIRDSLSDAVEG